MNILFVSAVLPYPLRSGGQIRMYHLLKRLSTRHNISLLSFIRKNEEEIYAKNLDFLKDVKTIMRGKGFQAKYILGALGNYPLLMATYDNVRMQDAIREALKTKPYDLVHIEPFYVYPSLPKLKIPLVVSEHNIEYRVYETYAKKFPMPFLRPFLYIDAVKMKVWEELIWSKAKYITAVSEEDAEVIRAKSKKDVRVVSNGVDTDFFTYRSHQFDIKHPTFLFVGDFAWAPNREAVEELLKNIWPVISERMPKAMLTVIGKQFPTRLRSFLTGRIVQKEYIDDIRNAYHTSDILLAPMGIGGGTKFKILEAMATGVFVITTKMGVMGLSVKKNIDFFTASSPQEFLEAVTTVYQSPGTTRKMTQHARAIIEKQYNWNTIATTLDAVWEKSR